MHLTATRRLAVSALACALLLGGQRAQAQTWINWQSFAAGSASGTIALGTGNLGVTYTGEVAGGATSTGYWNYAAYSSATAPNNPGSSGFVQLVGPSTGNTITFSSPVNRVFFAIMSLGQGGRPVTYAFNQAFTLLSQGPASYGGCGTCLTASGNSITGAEGDGVLMFQGPVTSLSFDVVGNEYFHGYTVGVDALAVTATPEPASLALLASGLLALAPLARRRRA